MCHTQKFDFRIREYKLNCSSEWYGNIIKLNIPNRFILGTQLNLHIINVNTKDFCVQYENSSNILKIKEENLRKRRMKNRFAHSIHSHYYQCISFYKTRRLRYNIISLKFSSFWEITSYCYCNFINLYAISLKLLYRTNSSV